MHVGVYVSVITTSIFYTMSITYHISSKVTESCVERRPQSFVINSMLSALSCQHWNFSEKVLLITVSLNQVWIWIWSQYRHLNQNGRGGGVKNINKVKSVLSAYQTCSFHQLPQVHWQIRNTRSCRITYAGTFQEKWVWVLTLREPLWHSSNTPNTPYSNFTVP